MPSITVCYQMQYGIAWKVSGNEMASSSFVKCYKLRVSHYRLHGSVSSLHRAVHLGDNSGRTAYMFGC